MRAHPGCNADRTRGIEVLIAGNLNEGAIATKAICTIWPAMAIGHKGCCVNRWCDVRVTDIGGRSLHGKVSNEPVVQMQRGSIVIRQRMVGVESRQSTELFRVFSTTLGIEGFDQVLTLDRIETEVVGKLRSKTLPMSAEVLRVGGRKRVKHRTSHGEFRQGLIVEGGTEAADPCMPATLCLTQVPCRTRGEMWIGLREIFEGTIKGTQSHRTVGLSGKNFVAIFQVGIGAAFEGLCEAQGADRDICLLISACANEDKARRRARFCDRSGEQRNEAIVESEAGAQRNVCAKDVRTANERIQREHSCIGVAGQAAVGADGVFGCKVRDQFVSEERQKPIRRSGGKLARFESWSQVATAIGIHDSSNDHGRQAAIRDKMIHNDSDLGEVPFTVKDNQKRHVWFGLMRRGYENVSFLPEDLGLHHFVFTDGQVEFLCDRHRDEGSARCKCEDYAAATERNHGRSPL